MLDREKIIRDLQHGKVIVMPTDTIYGISCLASDSETRERIAKIKGRTAEKKFVVLIGDVNQLKELGIQPGIEEQRLIQQYWPGPLTIAFTPLLAVRLPAYPELCEILKRTGPIVSTSANFSGERPAESVDEAKKMFGNEVSAYYDDGMKNGLPSTLVKVENNRVIILRQGKLMIY